VGRWMDESVRLRCRWESEMKIDQDYLKKLLEAFEAAPMPITDIEQLKQAGIEYDDDQFVFHMRILTDQGFLERDDGDPGFGMFRGVDGHISWSVARGHEFIEALRNKEVWATIKRSFTDASLNTLWDVSRRLLEGYAQKRIEDLLGKK
jgi:hypothetical protein